MTAPDPTSHARQVNADFRASLKRHDLTIHPLSIDTLQCNITYVCNQACTHCHVQASPNRTEMMNRSVIDQCLTVLDTHDTIRHLDVTGGAPEINPHFNHFVTSARKMDRQVIVRHNLTIIHDGNPLTGEAMNHLPSFFAEQQVELVCSFPYYQKYFTDHQRGEGVFDKSIRSLKMLNEKGYGHPGSGLVLNLVYNPAGAFLPGSQDALEADFKRELESRFGIVFNRLYTITNMPLFRFRDRLKKIGVLDDYWNKLIDSFNPCAAEAVMCRNQVSVGPDGALYDCDFNQVLHLQIVADGEPMTIFNFDEARLVSRDIQLAPHCYGCTAGSGSSCGGSTA